MRINSFADAAKFSAHRTLNFAASANELMCIVDIKNAFCIVDINNWGLKAKSACHRTEVGGLL
jgi:hypothetical protein